MKKAVIEMQFNWIFILIVGGLILTFFIAISQKQSEISDTKIDINLRRNMRTILTGSKVTPGSTSLISIPKTEIRYDCEGYSLTGLSPVKRGVMFAPSVIKTRELTISSIRFEMPYTIENFLYLTTPLIRYVLVNSTDEFAFEINKSLPPRTITEDGREKLLFEKEIVNLKLDNLEPEIKDKNNDRIKFVFFNYDVEQLSALNNLANMENEDVTAVSIFPDGTCDDLDCFGEVRFYEKQNDNRFLFQGSSYYLGEASLLGSIFSDEIETYNCNMKESFTRFSLATEVYLNRTRKLSDYYWGQSNNRCGASTDISISPLQAIKINSKLLSDNFPSQSEILNIYNAAQDLKEFNEQVIKLSCSEIY